MNDGDVLLSRGRVAPREQTEKRFEDKFGGKATSELEINPSINSYKIFKNGVFVIYGSDESDVDEPARLYLSTEAGLLGGELFYIPINNLKKIVYSGFPFIYHNLGDILSSRIKARNSLWGELEIKVEKKESKLKFEARVVFSRKEYNTIKKYIGALD